MNIFEIAAKIRTIQSATNGDSVSYQLRMKESHSKIAELWRQMKEEIQNGIFPNEDLAKQYEDTAKQHEKLASDAHALAVMFSAAPMNSSSTGSTTN